jgi:N-acetylglucosaminyl-diphospho-decaprenol L-rhamnosyltransferase
MVRATMPGADLSISVVSYRTPELVRACLMALAVDRLASGLAMDVTVVDNASHDGSAEMVRAEFPWVRLIENVTNVGFGAAHNQALLGSSARYVLVLNSDTAVASGALQALVGYLDAHPRVAVAGPRLRYPNGSVQPSRRRFPSVATLFLESTQVQRFWPDNAVLRRYYVADRSDEQEQEVDWLAGACLCVRGRIVEDLGLFDERFFMYSEELDLCRRYRAAGWRVAYVPSAEVRHHEGASARLDLAARDQRFQNSKLRYAQKWHGTGVARALRMFVIGEYVARGLEEWLKLAAGSRRHERRARLGVIGAGLRHALRG